jgi:uncharacterized iron-regulated membrane protein
VNLLTAIGLIVLNISAIMMWWRRRPQGVLGAPQPLPLQTRKPVWIWVPIIVLCVWLPLLGVSMLMVFVAERLVLRQIPAAAMWLGLESSSLKARAA